jgi:8-oxo-dGTP pyrophosphatase MutT (NUDIX family)
MAHKYKVFIQNNPIYFFDAVKEKKWNVYEDKNSLILPDPIDWEKVISTLEKGDFKKKVLVICSVNIKKQWEKFLSHFNLIKAGGGIVELPNERTLWIYRNGKWDLPKGKMDNDETFRQCAKREIMEETGLPNLDLGVKVCTTYHTYNLKGKRNLKKTKWYAATFPEDITLIPQLNEGISKAKWVKPKKTKKCLANTYPSITDVFRAFLKSKKLLI